MKEKNRRIQQGLRTRENILETAAQCFAEKGYDGCSMDYLAESAGLTKGGLYAHFHSKEELFTAMLRRDHERAIARAEKSMANPPYLDGLVWYVLECIRNSSFPIDHRLWVEVLAVTARNSAIRDSFAASEAKARAAMKSLLQKAVDNGEVRADLDVESASILLFALGDGLIARIADDPEFDFERHCPAVETAIRKILA